MKKNVNKCVFKVGEIEQFVENYVKRKIKKLIFNFRNFILIIGKKTFNF